MSSKKVRFERLILQPTAPVRMGAELHMPSSSGCIYYRQPHEDMDLPLPIIVVTALTHQAESTDVAAASAFESG